MPESTVDTTFMEKEFRVGKLLEHFEDDLRKIAPNNDEFLARYVKPLEVQRTNKKMRWDAICSILGVKPSTELSPDNFFANFVIKTELDKKAVELTIQYLTSLKDPDKRKNFSPSGPLKLFIRFLPQKILNLKIQENIDILNERIHEYNRNIVAAQSPELKGDAPNTTLQHKTKKVSLVSQSASLEQAAAKHAETISAATAPGKKEVISQAVTHPKTATAQKAIVRQPPGTVQTPVTQDNLEKSLKSIETALLGANATAKSRVQLRGDMVDVTEISDLDFNLKSALNRLEEVNELIKAAPQSVETSLLGRGFNMVFGTQETPQQKLRREQTELTQSIAEMQKAKQELAPEVREKGSLDDPLIPLSKSFYAFKEYANYFSQGFVYDMAELKSRYQEIMDGLNANFEFKKGLAITPEMLSQMKKDLEIALKTAIVTGLQKQFQTYINVLEKGDLSSTDELLSTHKALIKELQPQHPEKNTAIENQIKEINSIFEVALYNAMEKITPKKQEQMETMSSEESFIVKVSNMLDEKNKAGENINNMPAVAHAINKFHEQRAAVHPKEKSLKEKPSRFSLPSFKGLFKSKQQATAEPPSAQAEPTAQAKAYKPPPP